MRKAGFLTVAGIVLYATLHAFMSNPKEFGAAFGDGLHKALVGGGAAIVWVYDRVKD